MTIIFFLLFSSCLPHKISLVLSSEAGGLVPQFNQSIGSSQAL